jgi:restriction endonuclease Mrr
MKNKKLKELYRQLMNTKLNYMRPGEYQLVEIYEAVKSRFSDLCDDKIICAKVCSHGSLQPEWQHRVRNALNNLKSEGVVSKGNGHGCWIIH